MFSNRKKLQYTPQNDIILLMEVLDKNPYRNKGAWHDIVIYMRSQPGFLGVETKSLRDRVNLLLNKFRNGELHTLVKHRLGTIDEYTEREQLLQEVSDMEHKGSNEQWVKKRVHDPEHIDVKMPRLDGASRSESSLPEISKPSPSSSGQISPEPSSSTLSLPVSFSFPESQPSTSSQKQSYSTLSADQVKMRTMELEVKKLEWIHREQDRQHRLKIEMERLQMEKEERAQLRELLVQEREERAKSQEEERNLRRDLHDLVQQQIHMMRVVVEMLEKQ